MTTKLLIDRELLEQVASEFEHDNDRYMLGRELRKVLDAPPQPEGGGLDVVGWIAPENIARMKRGGLCGFMVQDKQDDRRTCAVVTAEDAQRAIAERDAAIEEWSGTAVQNGMECDRLRQQRDRLAGLLADVKADYTHAIHWEDMHATMKRIDAALAEVDK